MRTLQDKPAQVFILRQGVEALADLGLVDDDVLFGSVRGVEAQVFEHALQDRVQPAGADILGRSVHVEGDVGHGFDRRFGKLEVDPLGAQKRLVLAQQRGAGSRRILAKSSRVRSCISTRIGNRP